MASSPRVPSATDAGPYRSATLTAPARPRRARWFVTLFALLAGSGASLVASYALLRSDDARPAHSPPRRIAHGPSAIQAPPLATLNDAVELRANGETLCARSASRGWLCEPSLDAAARADRFALVAVHAPPEAQPFTDDAQGRWQLDPEGVVRHAAGDGPMRPFQGVPRVREMAHDGPDFFALGASGEVWRWTRSDRPRRVMTLRDAHDLTLVGTSVCVRANDALLCWSRGAADPATSARPVEGLTGIARVVGGGSRLCVVKTDASVWCGWIGPAGALALIPPLVPNPSFDGARALVLHGEEGVCALSAHGQVLCRSPRAADALHGAWRRRTDFGAVVGLPAVRQLAVSATHACALTRGGEAYCWGANDAGQIDASGIVRPSPTRNERLGLVSQIGVGVGFSCGLRADDAVVCVGAVGGTFSLQRTFHPLLPLAAGDRTVSLAVAREAFCTRTQRGLVSCQSVVGSPLARTDTGLGPLDGVTPMGTAFCAFDARHDAVCWRVTSDGRIDSYRPYARDLASLVATDTDDRCGLRDDGRLVCWNRAPPENDALQAPPGALRVASDRYQLVALREGGRLRFVGQHADVPGVEGVTQFAMADGLVCALHEDGAVSCAGRNDRAQLGDGASSPHTITDAVVAP